MFLKLRFINCFMEPNLSVCHVLLKKAIKKGTQITQKVEGESMLPTIRPGQTISLEYVSPSSIQVGDILIFRGAQSNVVHRLVKIEEKNGGKLYITKGDNNLTLDPPSGYERILGRVASLDGKKMSELESLEQRQLIVKASIDQERVGRVLVKILNPLTRLKIALIGRRSLGVIRLLKKLTRPI